MQDARRIDRTWLCSVLFLDIVNYSSQPVVIQVKWKAFFNAQLASALNQYDPSDRVTIDTGDGAVVCFLGEPEAALICSLPLLKGFAEYSLTTEPAPTIRVGINLGPIRLVTDLNGNRNAIGDGINVGQRIMSFAQPNQLLISRSYYEVVSTLSDDYRKLFRFDGVRHDKHIREHSVYAYISALPGDSEAAELIIGVPNTDSEFLSPERLVLLQQTLVEIIGPMGRSLVQEEAKRFSRFSELCGSLAEKFVPSAERALFLDRVQTSGSPQPGATPARGPVPASIAPAQAERAWDDDFLKALERLLAEEVGPIATIVIQRAARSAQSKQSLIECAVASIQSEKDRSRFLAKALRLSR